MNNIHPLATVSPEAKLGDNIEIGPYAFIDANVEIGDGCKILPHAVIFSYVKMGCDCTVFPGAVVGAVPQDLISPLNISLTSSMIVFMLTF